MGTVAFIAIGLTGHVTDGFHNRYSDNQKVILDFLKYDQSEAYREGSCFLRPDQKYSDFRVECFSSANSENSMVVWGDSHSAALSYGLRNNSRNVTQLTANACKPLIGYSPTERPHCIDINDYVLSKIEQLRPELLILHANWSFSFNLLEIDLKEALSRTVFDIRSVSPKTRIIIIGGVPHWSPSLPALLFKFNIGLREEAYVYSQDYKKVQDADSALMEVTNANNLTFISLLDIFCKNEECLSSVKLEDIYEPFAWDYGHLTRSSASLVSKEILLRIDANKKDLKP